MARRLRQWLVAAAVLVSGATCVVTTTLAVVGHFRNYLVSLTHSTAGVNYTSSQVYLEAGGGRLSVRWSQDRAVGTSTAAPTGWGRVQLDVLPGSLTAGERWLPHQLSGQGFTHDFAGVGLARHDRYATQWTPATGVDFQHAVGDDWDFAVTDGLLAVLTGGPVVAWLWRRRRRKVAGAAGRCVRCDYDLRASPDRCPECGLDVIDPQESPPDATLPSL